MLNNKLNSFLQLSCLSVALMSTGIINTTYAANSSSTQGIQKDHSNIFGKVADVINSAGFTYVEVEINNNKVWAAAMGASSIKKGDMIGFSTQTPMRNFHSKSLGRDFSLIYFVKSYITNKEEISKSSIQNLSAMPSSIRPYSASLAEKSIKAKNKKTAGILPDTTLYGLNVKNKKLSDYRGKPLIINVWASWCGPCRSEMGSLQRLANSYNGNQFNIIGISTDDYRNKAEDFISQAKLNFDNFLDRKLKMEKMLGADRIPLTVLIDDQGKVLEKVRGAHEWDSPRYINKISKAFNIKLTQ